MDVEGIRDVLTSIYRTASEREITFLAAGFAYYAFVSLIPIVLLALVVGSLFGGEDAARRLVLVAGDFFPAAGEDLITDALETEAGRTEATVVALAVGIWGTRKVFRGLNLAFETIYDDVGEVTLLQKVRNGIIVVFSGVGALVLMVVIGAILRLAENTVPFAGAISWITLFLGLVFVFAPIYYVLPPISVTVREIVPGVIFTAIGWSLLQVGFQLYTNVAGQYQAYGAVGAVLLFVTWLYFAGIIMLIGAVLNVVYSRPSLAA
ncbi:YihY/virulence factor BrkB family protein [Natronobacterium gregoryi]|uniref:Membrane protein n=2 Tax=Natronobacterium gregoryi TaxID=44930 RepID=L0AP35_NATGS|nr:YihY/virulence factor BrkB family protein [Natronobacterium gregoryi]AFZ74860.1 putative membrane protein [Natronobacterium gregoryi SP2]ELY73278.1 ribonuclease BN [Natronobacterium gregoryi SP2]PLK19314.1 YihY/virulence factor BrkB family protein [Natronobacterium gregoryi SP2]SFJ53829.1 membrane protein [Natronobacterium gregoryi]